MTKTILAVGADGYLGWYLSIYFAEKYNTNKVICVDNFCKRTIINIQNKPNTFPLQDRISIYNKANKKYNMIFELGDINDYQFTEQLILKYKPDVIIHTAHQTSNNFAVKNQFSMKWSCSNNINGILNILWAIKEHSPRTLIITFSALQKNNFLSLISQSESMYCKSLANSWKLNVIDISCDHVYGLYPNFIKAGEFVNPPNYDQVFGDVMNNLLINCIKSEKVILYGDDTHNIYITDINDFFQAIDILLQKSKKNKAYLNIPLFSEKIQLKEIIKLLKEKTKNLNVEFSQIPITLSQNKEEYSNEKIISWGLSPVMLKQTIREHLQQIKSYYG